MRQTLEDQQRAATVFMADKGNVSHYSFESMVSVGIQCSLLGGDAVHLSNIKYVNHPQGVGISCSTAPGGDTRP